MPTVRSVLAPNPGLFTLEGTNVWLVGEDPCLVIDPGPLDQEHLETVARVAGPIGAILLTHHHHDHALGAAALAALAPAPIFANSPGGNEEPVAEGDVFEAGGATLRAVLTPGHSPDHVAYFDPGAGGLFTGDAVLGRGTSVIDPEDGDMAQYIRSLERMRALSPSVIYPGHGPVVSRAREKLDEYLAHRTERERQIFEGLRKGPCTPEQLVLGIYQAYPEELHAAAARSVLAHLVKLEREGRVVRVSSKEERYALPEP